MSEMYRVRIEAFEGPMDLLLYLIRKHEVDIHDIPLSLIAEQYIGFLDELDRIDIDLAGEFLVMASSLMELKSRMLAAQADEKDRGDDEAVESDEPKIDPRTELVRQLLEYKKYRDAADALENRLTDWEKRYPVHSAAIDDESVQEAMDDLGDLEVEDLDLSVLVAAFRQIVASVNFDRIGKHEVVSDDTPLEVHVENIVNHLESVHTPGIDTPTNLRTMIEGKTRSEMVGMFLAILVLVRDQRISVSMNEQEIEMQLRTDVQTTESTTVIDDFAG